MSPVGEAKSSVNAFAHSVDHDGGAESDRMRYIEEEERRLEALKVPFIVD